MQTEADRREMNIEDIAKAVLARTVQASRITNGATSTGSVSSKM